MTFTFNSKYFSQVSRAAVLAAVALIAGCGGGGSSAPASPPPAATVSLSAAPAAFVLGQSGALTWSSTNASACLASGDWSGAQALTGTKSVTPTTAGAHVYTLTCDGVAASTTFTASAPVPVVSIGATPSTFVLGQSTTLTWSSSNVNACAASGDWTGVQALTGTLSVTPTTVGSHVYTLTCDGVAKSTTLTVKAPAPAVSISLSPASVSMGSNSTLSWSSSGASSCDASGAWAGTKATSGTTVVSFPTVGTRTFTLVCTGAGGVAVGVANLDVTTAASNVASIALDMGPNGTSLNQPFISVTICQPATSTCETIDHILVDTGSYGLRVIAPTTLSLPAVTIAGGNAVGECAQFVSGYTWGSVRSADVKIAGELALNLPIEIIGDTGAAYASVPATCSSSGANFGTVAAMGAKGILGVGVFAKDCGPYCVTNAPAGGYYGCTLAGVCTSTMLPEASQVTNPVSAFPVDNNGVVFSLPSVAAGGVSSLTGSLIFGIGTQTNNQVGSSAKAYKTDGSGNFKTTYKGVTSTSSFIDTGSNGLYFTDASLPLCTWSTVFYCPVAPPIALTATNISSDGLTSGTVNFTIGWASYPAGTVAKSIGGDGGQSFFDWGLPFFFGRTVFVAMSGTSPQGVVAPYWAY